MANCEVCVDGVFVKGVCDKCQSKKNSTEQGRAKTLKEVAVLVAALRNIKNITDHELKKYEQ